MLVNPRQTGGFELRKQTWTLNWSFCMISGGTRGKGRLSGDGSIWGVLWLRVDLTRPISRAQRVGFLFIIHSCEASLMLRVKFQHTFHYTHTRHTSPRPPTVKREPVNPPTQPRPAKFPRATPRGLKVRERNRPAAPPLATHGHRRENTLVHHRSSHPKYYSPKPIYW